MTLKKWVALSLLAVATSQAAAQVQIKQLSPTALKATATAARTTAGESIELYSTLSGPTDLYDYGWGPSILAINTSGPMQFFGVPFTPAVDASLSHLVLPVASSDGKDIDSLRVSIHADAAGVPGEPIYGWKKLKPQNSLTPYKMARTCCTYLNPSVTPGTVALRAGTTYWVVVWAEKFSSFAGLWYFNSRGLRGTDAYHNAYSDWIAQSDVLLPALGVYGTAP